MRKFNDDNFMLMNDTAVKIYRDYADIRKVPIIDYHCHIPVNEIREDKHYKNITELWLGADHYKWRQMRICGIDEQLITGDADDYDKFEAYASIMPSLIGNPLYHWSHMELKFYFGITDILNKSNARRIWDACNRMLSDSSFGARKMIEMSGVKLLCTTDDPADSLEDHVALSSDINFKTRVLPAFRPDNALDIEKEGWREYINRLSSVTGIKITDTESLIKALYDRIDYFNKRGCKTSDHGMNEITYFETDEEEADEIMKAALDGEELDWNEKEIFKTYILSALASEYKRVGWVMQLHYGVVRNINSVAYERLGINTGFDCMDDGQEGAAIMAFLDMLEFNDSLPKTVLYSLNPNDNPLIDCIAGSFAEKGVKGKVQHGSAWWFNDHLEGMTSQLKTYASMNTLGNHIGMLTDSRSFLSYTRHDYFRRILCNILGEWVEKGMYPEDYEALGKLVTDISYKNTADYFGFDID